MKNKVLLIEDNPESLELVSALLELMGFTVLQAGSAEEGLRLARHKLPALILIDISLPGMDGLTAVRLLRSDPLTQALKIVALTAHAMSGDRELALSAGCDGYLTKPIDATYFGDQIARFISPYSSLPTAVNHPKTYAR